MTHNSPFDDDIPREPREGGPEDSGSLHDAHWHDNSDGVSRKQADTDSSEPTSEQDPHETPGGHRCPHCGVYTDPGLDIKPDTPCPACSKKLQVPRCTLCEYDLSGLTVNQSCPECGKPIWDRNLDPPTSGLAITSLVLGILSVCSCALYGLPPLVLGPLAIIFGEIAVRQYKKNTRGGSTKGLALAGRICGWVSFSLSAGVFGLIIGIGVFF